MSETAVQKSSGSVEWLPWGPEAFTRARTMDAPILLAIGASWCQGCSEMSRTTYCDLAVCDLIAGQFVPIWVDADLRPDVNERYNLGGWPTTAFLSPDGQILGGETYVEPSRMTRLLQRVAEAFEQRRDDIGALSDTKRSPVKDDTGGVLVEEDESLIDWLEHHVAEQFDVVHGGFGTEPKQVHAPTVRFVLKRVSVGQNNLLEVATRTLDAIAWGGLYDDVNGGVFRYCSGCDWTAPHVEKLLDINASVLELLLDGWAVLGERRYRDRAVELIRYVLDTFADHAAGGFFSSQYADTDYYSTDAMGRQTLAQPRVDRSIYSDGTAKMAGAFLHAAAAFGDSSLLEFAATSLERVVGNTYQQGHGIAHDVDSGQAVRGLLADQVFVSDSLLDLYGATDREVYLDMAQELMRFSLRALWDTHQGGFYDRVVAEDDVGLLRQPLKGFVDNCSAARVLARLSHLTEHGEFRERAVATLVSQRSGARGRGVLAASWVLAELELDE